ncbi:hypothetical protein FB639_000661, partial [Coemansia asiatica]
MNRDTSNAGKLAEQRSTVHSNALNTADMQFSSYVLNGGQDIGRNSFSYSPTVNIPLLDNRGNHDSSLAGSRLFRGFGTAGPQTFSSTAALGSRSSISMSSTGNYPVNCTGSLGSSTFSCADSSRLSGHNSYVSLLNKANLLFENNLDSMMIDWTLEEQECRRRLVQFWRRHENNNIFCTFKSVAAADRVPNSIVVSCIYWEERQDFFITSVDCIHLLESLIAVRFTVEEKNRIRRNLEGFRPLTVSKCKADSIDFFKLIMSFPNPKPRNIEKDVKVFPWRILPLALKKIIGKYTASYSSTSSITLDTYPTPRATSYSQLVGIPPPANSGGMAAFNSQSPISKIFGSSSASAAVVAAAAAASASASASASSSSVFIPAASISPNKISGAGIKCSQASSVSSFDNMNMLYGGSSLIADFGACIAASAPGGVQGPVETNGEKMANGSHMHMHMFNSSSNPLNTEQESEAAPKNWINNNGERLNSSASSALGLSDSMRKEHLSSAQEAMAATSTAALIMPESMVRNQQSGQNRGPNQQPHQQQQYNMPHASSEYLMLSGDQVQFDFAGMATDHNLSLTDSSERLGQKAIEKEMLPASAPVSASSLSSSAVDYGFILADYGLSAQQERPHQQQQQRVARSQSIKKTTPRIPYNVDRAERRRGAAAASTTSERGVDDSVYSEMPSRVATSFSSNSGQNANRETSPSIPLILEQQCHSV